MRLGRDLVDSAYSPAKQKTLTLQTCVRAGCGKGATSFFFFYVYSSFMRSYF